MADNYTPAAEQAEVERLVKKVKVLLPLPQYNIFKSPRGLEFIGQGFFKIVFKYGDKAIKYYKFGRVGDREVEKLTVLSRLETFEQFYMRGSRWVATEFIEGDKLKRTNYRVRKQAVEKVIEDMTACLALGWSPNDFHFGNFLLEPSGRIRCIDVDLFKDIRKYDQEKKERSRQRALQRIEALRQKMLYLVQE